MDTSLDNVVCVFRDFSCCFDPNDLAPTHMQRLQSDAGRAACRSNRSVPRPRRCRKPPSNSAPRSSPGSHIVDTFISLFTQFLPAGCSSCPTNSVKALKADGHVVLEICSRTSRQTDGHGHRNTSLPYRCRPYDGDKHFSEFVPTRWRQKSTGIDTEQNYVTVTLRTECYSMSCKLYTDSV